MAAETFVMKKNLISSLLVASVLSALPSNAVEVNWYAFENGFEDSSIYAGLASGDLELMFLTGDNLVVRNGIISGFDTIEHDSDISVDDGIISGVWEDEMESGVHTYYLAIFDSENQTYRALAADGYDIASAVTEPLSPGAAPSGQGVDLAFEIGDDDQGDTGDFVSVGYSTATWPVPDDPSAPAIASFAVSGGVATLVVSGAESGVYYTVWSGATPSVQNTFVECKQATGSEVTFSFAATADAAFFIVGASRDEKVAP